MSEKKESKEGIDEDGNVLPGYPGHYRYRKEQIAKKARHGTTGMKEFGEDKKEDKPKEKQDKPPIEPKRSHDELKAMNKDRQVQIIQSYNGVDAEIPKYEDGRIKLILKLQKK